MKNKMLIICLYILLCFGCTKSNKIYTYKSIADVTFSDNLSFEYASVVNLNDIVKIKNGTIIGDELLINTYTLGENKITINYKDINNVLSQKELIYNVVDTTKPLILINSSYSTQKGKDINLINKVLCADNYDKRPDCKIEGNYDINKTGTYKLKYIATDSSNNVTSKSFKLIVKENNKSSTTTSNSSSKKTTYNIKDAIKKYKTDKTMIGIDVSTWQDKIDWNKVKNDGVEFAMIRLGFGHNRNNQLIMDKQYKDNILNAKKAGIKVGIYFFSYAKSIDDAIAQARYVIDVLDGETLELPIAFDWENWSKFNSYNISLTDINLIADAFIEEVEKHGYQGMLYSSKYYLDNIWNVNNKDTWLAHYTSKTSYSKSYSMWQFSNKGKVDGIDALVDLNVLYK